MFGGDLDYVVFMSVPPGPGETEVTDFEVSVAAKQFNWDVSYPGRTASWARDDIDNIHAPVNVVVAPRLPT
jgi:heme/copper-type cytochrome/quinol oxidase subunit 2